MAIIHANEENFENLINDELVLVDFYANWCGPCKMLGPVLEEMANERNNVKIVKVDIDSNHALARQYGVMSVPTLILFKKGQIVSNHIGYMAKDKINNWINDTK